MNESHSVWVYDNVSDFGEDVKETAEHLEISFMESIALWDLVLRLNHYDENDMK